MYIIITGAGVVGYHIASLLAEGKHEVTVIEPSEDVVDNIRYQLDVKTIVGNAATPRILKEAEVNRADLIIAVTNNDETNMLICFLAKELGAAMTVARVRNPEYSGYFITTAKSPIASRKIIRPKSLGIDIFINPEVEVAEAILGILSGLYPAPIENFAEGRVQIKVFRAGAQADKYGVTNKPLARITPPKPCVVAAITRAGEFINAEPTKVIKRDDHVYVVASRESMNELEEMFDQPQNPVKNVVIFGGGNIGFTIAERLEKQRVVVKLIEENINRCQEIAARLEHTLVLQGDATDRDLLIEQEVPLADAFIATTESDERNIICGLLAKNLGVTRSIVLANRPENIPLAEAVGVDIAVSPLLLAANKITHFVLHGRAVSAPFIVGKELQAIEFVTGSSASIAGRKISEAGLPKEVIVGAIIHNDNVIIPSGESVIQAGDHVVIISPPSITLAVEKLFT